MVAPVKGKGIQSNEYLVFLGAIFPMLILSSYSHSVFAYNDPNHCHGYNACYTIGYRDGYNDAQNGISPAYACVGHSENWCFEFNDGFRAGNGGSNIFYGQRSDQTSNVNVRGDNSKIIVNQQSDNQVFTSGHTSNGGVLPS
jgi:hypothetical protein